MTIYTPFSRIRIFICYHREDTAASSGRLYNQLASSFGKHSVFKDIFSMEGGDAMKEIVRDTIEQSDIFLPVIGSKWLEIQKNKQEKTVCSDDWVTYEINTALKAKIIVIPILVDDAKIFDNEMLPENLKKLAAINVSELTFKHYDHDIKKLIGNIRSKIKKKRKKGLRTFNLLIIASFVFAVFLMFHFISRANALKNGQAYGGGIIFYLDSTGRHGLLCSSTDLNSSLNWYDAMDICEAYRVGNYRNWRLPSKDELAVLFNERKYIGNFSEICTEGNFGNCSYWSSSSMSDTTFAWVLYFKNGLFWANYGKRGQARVRAIRSF